MEQSQIFTPQQYRLHIMMEAELEDMQWTNSPRDIFTRFAHYFHLYLDEISFLFYEGEINFIGSKHKTRHEKICSESMF